MKRYFILLAFVCWFSFRSPSPRPARAPISGARNPPVRRTPRAVRIPDAPREIENSMAVIDRLEETDDRAGLKKILRAPWPADASTDEKKLRLADMFDALSALTRVAPDEALREYRDLPDERMKTRLRVAVIGGLVDRGMTRANALRFTVEDSGSGEMN